MTTVASSLLDFILSLFSDDEAAARYAKDPEGELERAGLDGVKPADVDAVKNMETDYSPVSYHDRDRDHDCDDDKGSHGPVRHDGDHHHGHAAPVRHDDHDHDDKCDRDDDHDHKDHDDRGGHEHHGGQETAVIQHIQNNYTDIDIEHVQIAGGDAYAIWGEDVVLATGGSVAAGDDVNGVSIDNSTTDVDVDVDIKDSFNGSFNTDNSTTFNTDNSTHTATNSFNEDTNIADRGGVVQDNDVDVKVDDVTIVNDSFNGNTLAGGDVTTTEVEIKDVEDSAVNVGVAGGDVENEATDVDSEIEDSIVGQNAVGGEEAENEFEYEEDNSINLDVEIDDIVTGDNSAGDDLEQKLEIEDNVVFADAGADPTGAA